MKFKVMTGCLAMVLLFFTSVDVFAQPTEENLIQAWERIQKNDPKTEVFKKTGENTYKFKTKWFPFDGELRILNVTIDDRNKHISSAYSYTMGVVEVEWVNLPKDFMQKYSYSYSLWARGNMLYYVEADDKWITSNELFIEKESTYKGCFAGKYVSLVYDNMFLIIFIFVLIVFILIARATKKQQQKYQKYLDNSEDKINKSFELSQRSLEINKESLEIQKQILELLKK